MSSLISLPQASHPTDLFLANNSILGTSPINLTICFLKISGFFECTFIHGCYFNRQKFLFCNSMEEQFSYLQFPAIHLFLLSKHFRQDIYAP